MSDHKIKRFQVQHYKALQDVTLNLTSIHVLIGPNNSGETSILEAIAALCWTVDYPLSQVFTGPWDGCDIMRRNKPDLLISFRVPVEGNQHDFDYPFSRVFPLQERNVRIHEERFEGPTEAQSVDLSENDNKVSRVCCVVHHGESAPDDIRKIIRRVHNSLGRVHFYRWDLGLFSLPVALDSK